MSTEKIRIRIKAYDHRVLDNAAKKIVETVRRSGGVISGPVPLPTEIEKFTILCYNKKKARCYLYENTRCKA